MNQTSLPTSSFLANLFNTAARKAVLPGILMLGAVSSQAQAQPPRDSTTIVRGIVLNDRNGLNNNKIDGDSISQIIVPPSDTLQLYAYLVSNARVVDGSNVSEDGTFEIQGPRFRSYTVGISTGVVPIGSLITGYNLAPEWVPVGEGVLSDSTTGDGNPDLIIPLLSNDTLTRVMFGIDRRPQGENYVVKTNTRDAADPNKLLIPLEAFKGADPEDGRYTDGMAGRPIDLYGASYGVLFYDGVQISAVSSSTRTRIESFDPSKLRFLFQPGTPRQFGYGLVDDAGVPQSSPSIVYINVALPVELTSFTGRRDNGTNILEWTTATEKVNSGFFLERSTDGKEFEEAGFVPSKALYGFSNTPNNYAFKDNMAGVAPTYFYRLRQTDVDGSVQFSKTVKLGDGISADRQNAAGALNTYPTPSTGAITLDWKSGFDSYQITVRNSAGSVAYETVLSGSGALHNTIDLSSLPSGNYFLSVQAGDAQQTKLIKLVTR